METGKPMIAGIQRNIGQHDSRWWHRRYIEKERYDESEQLVRLPGHAAGLEKIAEALTANGVTAHSNQLAGIGHRVAYTAEMCSGSQQ
jgi:acetate kinase